MKNSLGVLSTERAVSIRRSSDFRRTGPRLARVASVPARTGIPCDARKSERKEEEPGRKNEKGRRAGQIVNKKAIVLLSGMGPGGRVGAALRERGPR